MPAVVQAKQPVSLELIEGDSVPGPTLEILLLAGGSRWDPPGQEGRAWALSHAVARPASLQVEVGRDHAWWVLPCGSGPVPSCAAVLERTLGTAPIDPAVVDAAAEALTGAPPEQSTTDAWFALAYEAHPYGHPVAGRTGALEVATDRLERWALDRRSLWTRPAVRARLIGPDRAALEAMRSPVEDALLAFPIGPVPDSAMKGPPTVDGPVLATLPVDGSEAHLVVGWALPRRPTNTTRLLPDLDDQSQYDAAVRCWLPPSTDGLSLTPAAEAPAGWPTRLTQPNHPAVLWAGAGDPAAMHALALAAATTPPEVDPECEALVGAPPPATIVLGWPVTEEMPPTPVEGSIERLDLPSPAQGLFR